MRARIRAILMHPFSRDVGYLTVGSFAKTGVAFIASIFITRLLGVENYGIYAISMSVASIILMFTRYSYDYSMTTVLSENLGEANVSEIKKSIIWFMKNVAVSNAILLIFIVLIPYIARTFYPHLDNLGIYVQIYLLSVFFTAFFSLTKIVLQTVRKVRLLTVIDVSKDVTWRLIAILAILVGLEILGVVLAQLITALLFIVISIYLYYRVSHEYHGAFPLFREILRDWRSVSFVKNIRFTFAITIDNNLASLYTSLPVFFLGFMSTVAEAAYLNLALNIIAVPRLLAGNIATMLSSVLPYKRAANAEDLRQWRIALFRAMKISGLGLAAFFIVFWIAVYYALPYVYGEDFRGALPSIFVLVLTNLTIGLTLAIGPVLRTIKRVDLAIIYNTFGLIAMIVVMYATVPTYGAVGAALGMFAWKVFHWVLTYHMYRIIISERYDAGT